MSWLNILRPGVQKKIKSILKPQGPDLKKIHDKFFDSSGKMKKEGKDIVKKGLKGLK